MSESNFHSAAKGIELMKAGPCRRCALPISGGVYVVAGERPYCKDCYEILTTVPNDKGEPVDVSAAGDGSIYDAPNDLSERDVEALRGDAVNHPAHYKTVPGVECIEVTRHFNFNRGNAIKYIWRAGAKGNEIEDLRKAIWHLNDEIAQLEARHGTG